MNTQTKSEMGFNLGECFAKLRELKPNEAYAVEFHDGVRRFYHTHANMCKWIATYYDEPDDGEIIRRICITDNLGRYV